MNILLDDDFVDFDGVAGHHRELQLLAAAFCNGLVRRCPRVSLLPESLVYFSNAAACNSTRLMHLDPEGRLCFEPRQGQCPGPPGVKAAMTRGRWPSASLLTLAGLFL